MEDQQENLPLAVQYDDGISDTAAEAEDRLFRGTFVKFKDGHYLAGQEQTNITGMRLAVLGCSAAWIKFQEKKLVEVIRRQPGHDLPPRETLDERDERKWPLGLDNKPSDPWKNTRLVYLIDPTTAELFTFSNSSPTGRGAVIELADTIQRMRYAHKQAVPIVELSSQSIRTKYGPRLIPLFKVVGWRKTGLAEDEEQPRQIEHENAYAAAKGRTLAGGNPDLDDEIPFAPR